MGTLILVRHSTTAASAAGPQPGPAHRPAAGPRAASSSPSASARPWPPSWPSCRMTSCASSAARRSRCRQTADRHRARALGVAAAPHRGRADGLLEIDYGAWDGLTADECRARDPELRAAWEADPFETRCPEGESGARRRAPRVRGPRPGRGVARGGPRAMRDRRGPQPRQPAPAVRAASGWPMREYRDRLAQDPAALQPRRPSAAGRRSSAA